MNVVARRPPDSPRMSYNRPPASPRDGSPHRQPPSPTYPRVIVPPLPSPRSSSLSYNSYRNSNANFPSIYSPTSGQYPFRAVRSPGFPDPQSPMLARQLPQEVYECIVLQLQSLHTEGNGDGCITCYMRDLYSLSLTGRAWERAVRYKLYQNIHIHGPDSPAQLKKYKWKRGSRLKLLRRTLRERKTLANVVRELRVPELDLTVAAGKHHAGLQEYVDLLASVVMVCPNLERLLGITLPYTHEFDRLTHALSTRKKLKEHAWIVGENPAISERAAQQAPNLLDQGQAYQFLSFHTCWSNLDTLMLHSLESNGILEHGVVLRMLNFLPSLRHLSVSCLNANDFTDRTLLFLPELVSLRLESLRGVSENGLSRYLSRQEAKGLQSMTLIDQNISSLLVISKILASLSELQRFSIVQQETAPILPEGCMVFQPILASASLKHLHWDLASPNADSLSNLDPQQLKRPMKGSNTPNFHLSQSILNAGFPSLKTLRAPSDTDPLGALQSVCRPTRNGHIMLMADRYSLPRSSHGSLSKRPLAMPSGNNLTSARIRAQILIDAAARDAEQGIKVVVTDYSSDRISPMPSFSDSGSETDDIDEILDSLREKQQKPKPSFPSGITTSEIIIPSCMGRVFYNSATDKMAATTPHFNLQPDIPGSDADGGLISWKHILTANQTWAYYTPSTSSSSSSSSSTSSQSLSVARTGTNSSLGDDIPSPSTTASSWYTIRSNGTNTSLHSPLTPTSPVVPPLSPGQVPDNHPMWARETCNGSWNQGNYNGKRGKDWWMHVEREKVGNAGSGSSMTARMLELGYLF